MRIMNTETNYDMSCMPFEEYIKVKELAFAYVPLQKICSYFEPTESLVKGTVFPSLYKPYK